MIGSSSSPDVFWLEDPTASPFRVLSDGRSATSTTVSLSDVVPLTGRAAHMRLWNLSGGVSARLSNSRTTAMILTVAPVSSGYAVVALSSSQSIQYQFDTAPAAGLYLDAYGYTFER